MIPPIIAITMGDPGGIGPEIILKSLLEIKSRKAIYVVIGSKHVFETARKCTQISLPLQEIIRFEPSLLTKNKIYFFDITDDARAAYKKQFKTDSPGQFLAGKISKWNAALCFASLKTASEWGRRRLIQGLVTAPLHKQAMRLIDSHFSGHTEYLAKTARVKDYAMMFASDRLRVTLATIHVPLKDVSKKLTAELITSKIVLTNDFLKRYFKIKHPKIGVAALNPHGREFGNEEEKVIQPAIKKALQKGIAVAGPLPGDQIFYEAYEGRLDGVIAMYHDQGLAPFKMIAFKDGVNVTLGLPYLRTSPDHGTGFDIAYQNKAFHSAFLNSLRFIEHSFEQPFAPVSE